jgi:hypothetical protein
MFVVFSFLLAFASAACFAPGMVGGVIDSTAASGSGTGAGRGWDVGSGTKLTVVLCFQCSWVQEIAMGTLPSLPHASLPTTLALILWKLVFAQLIAAGLFAPVAPSVFQVPTGLDGATTRAAWNFEFSVASQLTKIKSLDILELRIIALSGPAPIGSPFNLLTSVGPVTFADVIQDRWGVPSSSPLPTTNPTTFFSSAGDIFQVFS